MDMPGPVRRLLDVIVAGDLAWSMVRDLEGRGHDAEALFEAIALGVVTLWPLPRGQAVTLTPWGAAVLKVEIHERVYQRRKELHEDPYWAEAGTEPKPLRIPNRPGEVPLTWPELVEDPTPNPILEDEWGPVKLWGREIPRARAKGRKSAGSATRSSVRRSRL